jgi:hypothetical protein
MRKFAVTDSGAKVLTPEAHKAAEKTLKKQGHTSAANLNDSQRQDFTDTVSSAE